MLSPLLQEMTLGDVEEFEPKVVHFRRQYANLPRKMIVGNYGGNCSE
jgi:hypothetical protein